MTPAAAVLFVFVTHGAARGPADDVVAACLRALPAGTRPVMQTAPEPPADAVLAANAAAAGAVAAVVVAWPAADLPMAEVRALVGLPEHGRWVSRSVVFAPADQVPERERALGLVIASIVQEGFAESSDRAPPRGPQVAIAEPPAPAPSPAEAVAETASVAESASVDADRTGPWALEAGVTTAYESGTDADDAFGGTLAVRRFVASNLALRAGAAFGLTQRDTPDVTGLGVIGALGAGWFSAPLGRGRRFAAGVRADLLVKHESVRVSGYPLVSGDRTYWSAGADALGEVGLRLAHDTMLLVAAGLEEMFPEAEVVVGGVTVATLRHTRVVLQVGVLSRF
ncbi:MAG TPA: hypothetical protein VLT58_10280 [Polyangia bacterium]|nr:hypothetical protein [Polyangia bacterium]